MSTHDQRHRSVFQRLGQVFQFRSTPHHVEREIDAELGFHFQRQCESLIGAGMSPEAARREAHRRFGDVAEHRNHLCDIDRRRESMKRRGRWWEICKDNVRYGLRGLGASRGFTVTVIVTLALGIGANATMFGVVDRLLLSPPLGVVDPDTVRRVYVTRGFDRGNPFTAAALTYADVVDWATADGFDVTAFADRTLTYGRGEAARRLPVTLAAADFFELLGVETQLGRFFTDNEDTERAPTVVISDYLWQQELGGDAGILGRTLVMGEAEVTVIGVAPPGFTGISLRRVDAWLPLRSPASTLDPDVWETHRGYYWVRGLARLPDAAGVDAAGAEATAIHRAARADTDYDSGAFITMAPLVEARGPRASQESSVARWLTGVSAVVLLIACANVANLLLARALRRRREIGVRLALGISRSRLIGQLVTESLLLALLGGIASLAVAYWGSELMRSVLLPSVHWPESPINLRVIGFTFAVAAVAGVLAGVVPALQSSRPNLIDVLKTGGRDSGLRRSHTRTFLLVAQAALSVLLLVGAGLFVRSLNEVRGLDLGIDPDPVALAIPEIPGGSLTDEEATRFFRRAVERLGRLPSVQAVAASASTPFRTTWGERVRVPGVDELPELDTGGPYINAATPEIFDALGLHIVEGRGFLPHEDASTTPIAVVDESMARLIWPGESPLGKCLLIGEDEVPPCNEVVGVVESSRRQELIESEGMQYYVPLGQGVSVVPESLFIRADPESFDSLLPAIRTELHALLPGMRYATVRPYRDYIDPQARSWRLGASMFTVFGALALVIAAVGLYGVLAFNVAQRTHELGVRTALGATPGRLVGMVLVQAMRMTAVGIGIGLLAALAAGNLITPLLFNVSARDPLVLGTVAVTLGLVAAAAAALPAWRATRINPNAAFRVE